MKRREILKYTALMTGAAVSAPLLSSILSGCTISNESLSNFQAQFFSKEDFKLVTNMVDVILPKTDSPSASEVGVDQTIDTIINQVYKEEDQQTYANGFSSLVEYLKNEDFEGSTEDEKLEILKKLDQSKDAKARKAFLEFKQQAILFYLSSEEVGEKFLNYLPVPGAYEPCISLESVGGKIWSI